MLLSLQRKATFLLGSPSPKGPWVTQRHFIARFRCRKVEHGHPQGGSDLIECGFIRYRGFALQIAHVCPGGRVPGSGQLPHSPGVWTASLVWRRLRVAGPLQQSPVQCLKVNWVCVWHCLGQGRGWRGVNTMKKRLRILTFRGPVEQLRMLRRSWQWFVYVAMNIKRASWVSEAP